jgi:hypothetical protein
MTICPIAIAVGCARCPIVKVCPVKTVIGDWKPAEPEDTVKREPHRRKAKSK